jgi:hypothetical protein
MTPWRNITFNPEQARLELTKFDQFLNEHPELSENEVRSFLNQCPQLIASLGQFNGSADRIDRWAPELDLLGKHACDYVVGYSRRAAYVLVELEDATPTGVFKPTPVTPYLTDRFNHGFSQIVDWLCLLDGQQSTPQFQSYWGTAVPPQFVGLLIVGRRAPLSAEDCQRLEWRNTKVKVNSHSVLSMTYEDLVERLADRLDIRIGLKDEAMASQE